MTSTEGNDTNSAKTEHKPDVEQLQAEIEQNRSQLGETVDALSARLDVKSRAKVKLDESKQRAAARFDAGRTRARDLSGRGRAAATTADGKPAPAVLAGAGLAVASLALTGVLVWMRHR